MIGFAVTVTGFGGSAVDYTSRVMNCNIKWPATTAVPTCTVEFANEDGAFASVGLFGTIQITLPGFTTPFFFYYEKPQFVYRSGTAQPGGVANMGHSVRVDGSAAPELLYMSEGNLDVVGTDLAVGQWNARPTVYVPYPSTFVSAVGTNLLDIGNAFTALLHTAQPGQKTGYRGRLGYDCTGAGLVTSTDIDYLGGTLGFYVKGMWQVGLGATGSQKTGLDIIRDLCTKNVIDGTGNPNVLDWFVDNRFVPPLLAPFSRGAKVSGVTFTLGTDAIRDLALPIDSQDVRNFVVYWSNSETVYPNGGDAWSNYDTNAHMQAQWVLTNNVNTGTEGRDGVTTRYGYGSSNFYLNGAINSNWQLQSKFSLATNNYAVLNKTANRGISAVAFSLQRAYAGPGDVVRIALYDDTGANIIQSSSVGLTAASVGGWQDFSLAYPASGTGNVGVWAVQSGAWNYATTPIGAIEVFAVLGNNLAQQQEFWVDYVHFIDNWGYSPTYSYNASGPTACTLTATSVAPTAHFTVTQTAGLLPGQLIVLEPGTANEEVLKISTAGAMTIITTTVSAITHNSGSIVIGCTHDPNSIAQFKYRIFNFVDFYINTGATVNAAAGGAGSDTAESIAYNILNSRKGKKSTGTITVDGYNQGVSSILPGYRFSFADPKDVYTGGSSDSTIDSWIADEIEYDLQPLLTDGFKVTYTVEPYYSSVGPTSPDSNPRNLWRSYSMDPGRMISRLQRTTQSQGTQP